MEVDDPGEDQLMFRSRNQNVVKTKIVTNSPIILLGCLCFDQGLSGDQCHLKFVLGDRIEGDRENRRNAQTRLAILSPSPPAHRQSLAARSPCILPCDDGNAFALYERMNSLVAALHNPVPPRSRISQDNLFFLIVINPHFALSDRQCSRQCFTTKRLT